MKKLMKAWAVLAAAAMLGTSFISCGGADDDGGGSKPSVEKVQRVGHLVKFNAADTQWAATDMVIKGSASSGGKEGYLVLNHKIDLEKDDITIEADVKFSS